MAEPESPGLRDDYIGELHVHPSWGEFFAECQRLHDKGVPYSLLKPDNGTIARLGPMPVPPWVSQ